MSKKAGAVSAETKERILKAARSEFAVRGFQGTSLRKICSEAGVTTGALYFFFDGKDDLFASVLSEITGPFMEFMKGHYDSEHEFLNKSPVANEEEDFEIGVILIDFYFQHRQTWDILLAHQNHPYVEAFMDSFIDYSTDHYMLILNMAGQAHLRKHPVDRFALHQFVHMQVDAMLTLVSHNFERDEMVRHSRIVTKMLKGAFQALLTD